MNSGAFHCPLNETGLAELGRLTYLWGVADMLGQQLLSSIAKTTIDRDLIMPLMIEKKAQILKRNLSAFPENAQPFVTELVKTIVDLNTGRNHAAHGFWGWQVERGPKYRSAAYSHKSPKPFYAEEVGPLADRLASATISGHKAVLILSGVDLDAVVHPVNFMFGAGDPDDMLQVQS